MWTRYPLANYEVMLSRTNTPSSFPILHFLHQMSCIARQPFAQNYISKTTTYLNLRKSTFLFPVQIQFLHDWRSELGGLSKDLGFVSIMFCLGGCFFLIPSRVPSSIISWKVILKYAANCKVLIQMQLLNTLTLFLISGSNESSTY